MKKDFDIFLYHILESIEQIEQYTKAHTRASFLQSVKTQDAVLRRFTIIGEAIRHLPSETRKQYPEIFWKQIAGMRDKIVHDYFGIDLPLVWDTAKHHLDSLKMQIKKILKEG